MYLIPLLTMPYVARVLGTYGVGVYSYTSSIISIFVVLTTMEVSLYGRREIASCISREDRTNVFWSIFFIESSMLLFSLVTYSLYVVICASAVKIALWIQLLTLLGAWLDISWLFFGVENFKIAILRNILVRVISLICIFCFVKDEDDVNLYIFILAMSDFISVVPLWTLLNKYVGFPLFSMTEIKQQIIPMMKMLLVGLSMKLYSIFDKIVIGAFVSLSLVGIYDNAFRISKVLVALIATIGVVMMPRITRLMAEGEEKQAKDYFMKSMNITLFISSGCAFGLVAVSPTFIPLYLGEEFTQGVTVTQLLSVVLIFIAWGNVFRSQFILPRKMDGLYVKSVVFAVLLNVGFNIILIPKFSIIGASLAYVFTELFICVYQTYKVRMYFNLKLLLYENSMYVISSILMLIILVILNNLFFVNQPLFLSLIYQIIIGSATYICIVLILESLFGRRTITSELCRMFNSLKK